MKEGLDVEVWDYFKNTSVGVFLKLSEVPYTWAGKRVHYILTNLLKVNNNHEIWSLIGGQPIRFSLNEFTEITELNCEPINEEDNWEVQHNDFRSELGASSLKGPIFKELEDVMDRCKNWIFEKKVMIDRLCILHVGIHGIHHGSQIPLESAKRVLDSDVFENYPWGRVAFNALIDSIKGIDYKKEATTLHGFVHVLLIWLYESVPFLGVKIGNMRETTDFPLLNWRSSRYRTQLNLMIKKEMNKNDGKLKVRHMVPVTEDNMYPLWSDNDDNKDPLLDCLIKDIINDKLCLHAWDEEEEEEDESEEDEDESRRKKMKIKDLPKEYGIIENVAIVGLMKMMKTLTNKIENMDSNMGKSIYGLEGKIDSKIDELKVNDAKLAKRMDALEKDVNKMRSRTPRDALRSKKDIVDDEA